MHSHYLKLSPMYGKWVEHDHFAPNGLLAHDIQHHDTHIAVGDELLVVRAGSYVFWVENKINHQVCCG